MTHEPASTIVDGGDGGQADAPSLRPPKPPPEFNHDLPNTNRSSVSIRRLLAGPPWDRRCRRLRRRRGRQFHRQEKLTPENQMSTTPTEEASDEVEQHLDAIERHARAARGDPIQGTPWEFRIPTARDLRQMRKACGLSRDDVAEMTDYSPDTINNYETGQQPPGRAYLQMMLRLFKREWPR